jgi:hypothetical protein
MPSSIAFWLVDLGNVIAQAFQIRNLISCFLIASISVVIPHVNIYRKIFQITSPDEIVFHFTSRDLGLPDHITTGQTVFQLTSLGDIVFHITPL